MKPSVMQEAEFQGLATVGHNTFRFALLIVFFTILLTGILATCNSCQADPQPVPAAIFDSIGWINAYNDQVVSLRAEQEAFELEKHDFRDSMAKAFKTQPKKLIEAVTFNTHTSADVPPAGSVSLVGNGDFVAITGQDRSIRSHPDKATRNLRQHFASPYYDAEVQIGDSSYMHLQARDTVSVVWKRVHTGGLFNRRSLLQLDISLANPDSKVAGLRAYRVADPKPKRWGIGLQAGVTYDPEENKAKPYIGFGLSYNPIRF
jgi:hypothetical protein